MGGCTNKVTQPTKEKKYLNKWRKKSENIVKLLRIFEENKIINKKIKEIKNKSQILKENLFFFSNSKVIKRKKENSLSGL